LRGDLPPRRAAQLMPRRSGQALRQTLESVSDLHSIR
jgi:hypothetical protein